MLYNLQVGKAMHNALGDIAEAFRTNPTLQGAALRVFGSMHEAAMTTRAPNQTIYDLDVLCLVPRITDEIKEAATRVVDDSSSRNSAHGVTLEPFYEHFPADTTPPEKGQKIIVHFQMFDPKTFSCELPRFRHSLTRHGFPIYGRVPQGLLVERLGLKDVMDEPGKRIEEVLARRRMGWEVSTKSEGAQNWREHFLDPGSLTRYCIYSVTNLAANVLNVLNPYTPWPHFEKGRDCAEAFRSLFPAVQGASLPGEVFDLQERMRSRENVSTEGLEGETLNFLSAADQMLRNITG